MCISGTDLPVGEHAMFRQFCELLQSVFHFEYHESLERLKDLYAPVNPDRDTRRIAGVREQEGSFVETLDGLLDKANYEKMSQADIELAFEESSLFQVKLDIDFDQYEEVLLYTRGESQHLEQVSTFFGLIKKEIGFSNLDRVVIYIRFKQGVASDLAEGRSGVTMLKLFQNVPRADVEMLFPNTRVAMRTIDKLLIGVPAVIGAGAIITTNVGASLLLLGTLIGFWLGLHSDEVELNEARMMAILAGLGGLASYIWKQFSNFRNKKLLFMQSLTRSLYFKNLDNNAGVFYRLVDDAEEEECKEAILAYSFLLQEPGLTEAELDQKIETWFKTEWQAEVDFEVDDGLSKLRKLNLVEEREGTYRVVPLEEASRLMDERWDNYFDHNNRTN